MNDKDNHPPEGSPIDRGEPSGHPAMTEDAPSENGPNTEDNNPLTEVITFDVWAHQAGLNRKTTSYLRQQDLASFNTLQLLSDTDVKDLDVTLGQKKVLLSALRQLYPATGAAPQAAIRINTSSVPSHQRKPEVTIGCGPTSKMAAPVVATSSQQQHQQAQALGAQFIDISMVRRQAAQLNDAGKHLNHILATMYIKN